MSLWSAQQHEWLEAMGLEVLALTSAAPVGPVAAAPQPPAPSARTAAPVGGPGDALRLQRALLHALRSCADPVATLAALQVDLDALRSDVAARRALWPRLRALRSATR